MVDHCHSRTTGLKKSVSQSQTLPYRHTQLAQACNILSPQGNKQWPIKSQQAIGGWVPTSNEERNDLAGIVSGDEKAFERIYKRYRDRVYGFAYRMVNTPAVAEDVTHEAFMVLIERPQQYDPERGSMLTFLCAVARNHIMHYFRESSREVGDSLEGKDVDHLDDECVFRADQLTQLLDEELAAEIGRAVESLPVLLREAIVLREFQELRYEEIAEVAGVSINTIKVRLHRARRALACTLTPYLYAERGMLL